MRFKLVNWPLIEKFFYDDLISPSVLHGAQRLSIHPGSIPDAPYCTQSYLMILSDDLISPSVLLCAAIGEYLGPVYDATSCVISKVNRTCTVACAPGYQGMGDGAMMASW
jgi:hypothetical protein